MLPRYLFISLVCLACHCMVEAQSSLREKIYFSLNEEEYHMCFKRLNETHQVGCSSKKNGNVGILYLLEKDADLDWLESKADQGPYIVLMTMTYFNEALMKKLIRLKKITGVLVEFVDSSLRPTSYSPDKGIPNEEFSIYNSSQFKWNKFGDGLLFLDIPFPVALLTNSSTIKFLKECHSNHNVGSGCPWCAVRVKSFMSAAVDSVVCHRRSHMQNNLNPEEYCDPIGSQSVISSLGPWRSENLADDSVILIVTKLDALSMFDGISPGYDGCMTGFVALQSVARLVGRIKGRLQPFLDRAPVMFALFNGESLGQAGSMRFVYDMNKGDFKFLNVSSIRVVVELGQLGVHDYDRRSNDVAWVHFDRNLNRAVGDKLDKVLMALTNQTGKVKIVEGKDKLPPSSLQSFLKKNPKIAGVYISNHDSEFTNRYYNAFLDDIHNVDISNGSDSRNGSSAGYVQGVSVAVACAIYTLVTDRTDCQGVIVPEANYTSELFNCFGIDADCELFNSTVFENGFLSETKNKFKVRYAGIIGDHSKALLSVVAHRALLARSLGDKVDRSICGEHDFQYINDTTYLKFKGPLNESGQRTPECYKAHVLLPYAVPPVFEESDLLTGTEFSAWTESRWGSFSIDVFLLPCYAQEVRTLVLGLSITGIFFPMLIFINYMLLKEDTAVEA